MDPSIADIAWLAGILEGEGCFGIYPQTPRGTRMALICVSTDLDVLESAQRIAGCGSIKPRTTARGETKPAFAWRTQSRAEVVRLINLVLPYMHSRRREKIVAMMVDETYRRISAVPAKMQRVS
jgi:hypothetical protein